MFKMIFSMLFLSLSLLASANTLTKDASLAIPGEPKEISEQSLTAEFVEEDKAGIQDFTLINRTGQSICRVYVSPSYDDTWGEDILGASTLPNNASLEVSINGYGNHCDFDVRVVACSGAKLDQRLNLCEIGTYTVLP